MIPPFEENGYLPPGTHLATLDEIEARFGVEPEIRRAQMQSLHWLVDIARRASAARLIINGSFVTDIPEPNDIDCAVLIDPAQMHDASAVAELGRGLPFLEIQVLESERFTHMCDRFFATDRDNCPKGVVEVIL